jgi:hypothetical protein
MPCCGQLICVTLTVHNNNAVSIISFPRKMCKSPFSHSGYAFLTQEWLVLSYAVTELVCFKGPKWVFLSWLDNTFGHRMYSLFRFRDHTQTHHFRQDSPGRVIDPSQRPLPINSHHSQEKRQLCPSGIRTRNPRELVTADRHLRPRSHWESHPNEY